MTAVTTFVTTLAGNIAAALRARLGDPERGDFQLATGMAIAAFSILAAVVIFGALRAMGVNVVAYLEELIRGATI